MKETFEALIEEFEKQAENYPQIMKLPCPSPEEFAFKHLKRSCHWKLEQNGDLLVYLLESNRTPEMQGPYGFFHLDKMKAICPGASGDMECELKDIAENGILFVLEKPDHTEHYG